MDFARVAAHKPRKSRLAGGRRRVFLSRSRRCDWPWGRVSRAAKGADCKSAGYAFVGSSPTSPTTLIINENIEIGRPQVGLFHVAYVAINSCVITTIATRSRRLHATCSRHGTHER